MKETAAMGPLSGLKVVELAGIGPGPMAAMLLADLGATVLRIDRTVAAGLGVPRPLKFDLLLRNRPVLALDLKKPEAVALVLRLVETSDALIEGFRPGVTERLGLGPDACLERNPKLVYGRMTGWGQDGPLAQAAGHDLNYIALVGALHAIGRQGQPPTIPLNLVGDYGGGALYLAFGVLAALWEAARSGKGQVVDAAITDGVASLMTSLYGVHGAGILTDDRGTNATDSGSHFYEAYECADGKYISLAPIEGKFHAELLQRLGIDPESIPKQWDKAKWPEMKMILAERFRGKTRDEWCALLEGTDTCFAPVLSLREAPTHPHNVARGTFIELDGVTQPAPAPRFSRTKPAVPRPPRPADTESPEDILAPWISAEEIAAARSGGVIA
jgi:crotonobetainyl-CoA:carnitine CoA-transferase CaiB-like acyl-CoA transferase